MLETLFRYKPFLLCCRVGMVFLPNDDKLEAESRQILEDVVAAEGRCHIVGWRKVPVDRDVVGRLARVTEPRIWQVGPLREHNPPVTADTT